MQDIKENGKSQLDELPNEMDYGSSEHLVSSTTADGEDNNVVIVEESSDPHSIAGILYLCKRKLLRPYVRFLSLVGLRPIIGDSIEPRFIIKCLNTIYIINVVFFLVLGYFLQYISCFRRDKGFGSVTSNRGKTVRLMKAIYDQSCNGSLVSAFVIPNLLHFVGYIYALIIWRRSDDNQLLILIERVFIALSHVPNMQTNQRKIVKTLWLFVIGSFVWMLCSITLVSYMMAEGNIAFRWFDHSPPNIRTVLKCFLVIGIIWQDIVQASVISSYCLQVQLLKKYVEFIRQRLLLQPVRALDWIRDIEEFRKLLIYLNGQVAPVVCIFTVINWTYAISGTLWLLANRYEITNDSVPLYATVNILNVVLWWFIAAVPFVQAARLTIACNNAKTVGQEVRTRPFAHQDTPLQELNSILIYTASLKINAKDRKSVV